MQTKPIVQGSIRENRVHIPGTRFQPFRLHIAVLVTLATVTLSLLPAGCAVEDEAIEVAVLYWGRVKTSTGEPIAGRTVYFAAVRYTYGNQDNDTLVRRTAATTSDGRTYLDARFLVSKGQTIMMMASTTATDPLSAPGQSDVEVITYTNAVSQSAAQGQNGLASFERFADFTE